MPWKYHRHLWSCWRKVDKDDDMVAYIKGASAVRECVLCGRKDERLENGLMR